jgi:hypothetical protein
LGGNAVRRKCGKDGREFGVFEESASIDRTDLAAKERKERTEKTKLLMAKS